MSNKTLSKVAGGMVAAVMVFGASQANALTYGFSNITGNSAVNAASGEAQLFVDVNDAGGGNVSFNFFNIGPDASSITDVYFQDGGGLFSALFGLIDADDGVGGDAGVDFSPGASPGNVPGANGASPPFVATSSLSADSDPPAQPNGVNPGESLIVLLALASGNVFADVLSDLGDAVLRIAFHVQGFANGGSESFVNTTPGCIPGTPGCGGQQAIPLPAAFPLFATALGGLGLLGWRRRRKAAV